MKELLFSLTARDFKIEHIRGSGPGGQHRNKVSTGVRITHPASGAVGVATDSRSQKENKRQAFRRLVNSPKFKAWHRLEVARRTGELARIETEVDASLRHVKVEVRTERGWELYSPAPAENPRRPR